ncbi:hypothetical protein BU24DRAFT_288907 [Aaosphaeria arxii CBS 175.79]|uniref:Uncharacterized protein n=1 Tax=Aaosphaeria arxii CBS 175.79 TaxID=1450172 RepID=A0A6A5XFY5_9PLEO|nr:uncharacterized protein BU24DRAFT_288907 [Aaosphaeria arxii CBS 175.79]KAF2011769.1 hypothetical protein BU24DRAFT_288907 [Aaosphaeria arxii CBS 175.79]
MAPRSRCTAMKRALAYFGEVDARSRSDAIMIIDSDDDEPPAKTEAQAPPPAEFEEEEEELDPEQPYPSIVQQVRLSLNTEVLHIGVPQIPAVSSLRPADTIPAIFGDKMVFTVACADYSVRVVTLPLSPPSNAAKEAPAKTASQFGESIIKIPTHAGHQSIPRGVAMTWTTRAEPRPDTQDQEMDVDDDETQGAGKRKKAASGRHGQSLSAEDGKSEGWDLLVASHSIDVGGLIKIYRFQLTETGVAIKNPVVPYQVVKLRTPPSTIAFNTAQWPKRRHSQLLIADATGTARIYDPFAVKHRKGQTSAEVELGAYIALFRSTYDRTQSSLPTPPILAARKPIIDAVWTSDGHGIFALLGDGEWGVWDIEASTLNQRRDPSDFSSRGFVGSSEDRSSGSEPSPKRSARGNLVPMTPNTRRTKQQSLFSSTTTSSSAPIHGSLSIASLPSSEGGVPIDSVLIEYGVDVYRISNLAQFTTRSASGSSSTSPHKLQGLNLLGESLVSAAQFDLSVEEARKAIPRDVLIATDHRLIILTNTKQPLDGNQDPTLDKEQAEEKEARRTDQALLAQGELDIGGMGRLLEDMEGSGSRSLALGNPRKVLFASSTS